MDQSGLEHTGYSQYTTPLGIIQALDYFYKKLKGLVMLVMVLKLQCRHSALRVPDDEREPSTFPQQKQARPVGDFVPPLKLPKPTQHWGSWRYLSGHMQQWLLWSMLTCPELLGKVLLGTPAPPLACYVLTLPDMPGAENIDMGMAMQGLNQCKPDRR